jgi:hypothetical protein
MQKKFFKAIIKKFLLKNFCRLSRRSADKDLAFIAMNFLLLNSRNALEVNSFNLFFFQNYLINTII